MTNNIVISFRCDDSQDSLGLNLADLDLVVCSHSRSNIKQYISSLQSAYHLECTLLPHMITRHCLLNRSSLSADILLTRHERSQINGDLHTGSICSLMCKFGRDKGRARSHTGYTVFRYGIS